MAILDDAHAAAADAVRCLLEGHGCLPPSLSSRYSMLQLEIVVANKYAAMLTSEATCGKLIPLEGSFCSAVLDKQKPSLAKLDG